MKLANFTWSTKQHQKSFATEAGGQIILDFGKYHLSIIDDGYGGSKGFYEIATFDACDGVASDMVELPGITNEGDTVKGWLTESDVDSIIMKLYTATGKEPRQV